MQVEIAGGAGSRRYALIRDGAVVNIVIWDGVTPYDPGADAILVPTPPAAVSIGWRYAAGEFAAPPAEEPVE